MTSSAKKETRLKALLPARLRRSPDPGPDPDPLSPPLSGRPALPPDIPPTSLSRGGQSGAATSTAQLQRAATIPRTASNTNGALLLAIQRYTDDLPDSRKQAFRDANINLDERTILARVQAVDDAHKNGSKFRACVPAVQKTFELLARFLDVVAIAAQASPDIASIVVGAFKLAVNIGVEFLSFFTRLSDMISRLGDFLDPLAEYAKCAASTALIEESLAGVYRDILDFSQKAYSVFAGPDGQPRRFPSWRLFWRTYWLPFDAEFGDIEASMQHHLQVLQHAASATSLGRTFDAQKQQLADGRESFLNWLSSLPMEERHETIYKRKHPDTGEWLIQTTEFEDWFYSTNSSLLWCYGSPGAGKSVLASNVIEYITREREPDPKVGIAFIYYDYLQQDTDNIARAACALLKQLCRKKGSIPTALMQTKRDALPSTTLGTFDSLRCVAQDFEELFIVVDALDECSSASRYETIGFLRRLLEDLPNTKLFVTSRLEDDIQTAFEGTGAATIRIEAKNTVADIKVYVSDEVATLRQGRNGQKLYIQEDGLGREIVQALTTKADGMFLWVRLQLEELCRVSTSRLDRDVRKALQVLPTGLDKTYARIMSQIQQKPDNMRSLALRSLQWTFFAGRPLSILELRWAITLSDPNFDAKNVILPAKTVILEACSHLLAEDRSKYGKYAVGESATTIRAIHYSVQECITGELLRMSSEASSSSSTGESRVHEVLAQGCLRCLEKPELRDGSCYWILTLKDRFSRWPFLWYAAQFFDHHYSLAEGRSKETVAQLLGLLAAPPGLVNSILQARSVPSYLSTDIPCSPNFDSQFQALHKPLTRHDLVYSTILHQIPEIRSFGFRQNQSSFALHRACQINNMSTAVSSLLQDPEIDINEQDFLGLTPLYHAASRGCLDIVHLLLDHGADPDAGTSYNYPPLFIAARSGYYSIVEALLDAGADIQGEGDFSGGALQEASFMGHGAIVKLFLDRGAAVNATGSDHGTALQAASYRGVHEAVEILLRHGADVNLTAGEYGTALQAAARGGHYKVVQTLLGEGAEVNAVGGYFGTALQAASRGGSYKVAHALLASGANVDITAGYYGTALQAASFDAELPIVELLLDFGADVNARGGRYRTALHAVRHGKKRIQHRVSITRRYDFVIELLVSKGANIEACKDCEDVEVNTG